ncbi:MAG: thiopeptide-type bacteriocin biosynthesis protein [Lactobacillaceae bacterium]
MNNMGIPQYVQLEVSDNHILLDLENDYFLDEIRKGLKTQGNVRLREIVGEINDRLKYGEAYYSIECVFEIERDNFTISKGKDIKQINSISTNERLKLPLDNWVFMKIYLGKNLHLEFISNQLTELIQYLKKENLISKWFYIIYEDPSDHIRLRFYNENSKKNKLLLEYLIKWNSNIVKNNGVTRICFDTYESETSRYGGPLMIDVAEDFFQKDSELSLSLVKINRYNQISLPDYILGVLSILELLNHLKMDDKEQMTFLSLIGQKTDYKKEYREWKNFLFDYRLKNIKEQENLKSLFKIRKNELEKFSKKLNQNENILWNTEYNIIASLIHMNCNRLFGTDRELEKKVLSISSHMLRDWCHYQQHVLKK